MPTTHPNAAMVRRLFAAFERGDLETILAVLPPDVTWHFPGRRGQLAGDHPGREAVLAFLARVPALTNGTFRTELVDVVANDTTAVVLFRGHATREGRTLDNPTCLRIRIEDGRPVEVWEFVWDLFDVDAFWS